VITPGMVAADAARVEAALSRGSGKQVSVEAQPTSTNQSGIVPLGHGTITASAAQS
jgi:hypothetical protein